MTVHCSEALSL